MRKIIVLAVALASALSLTGCGKNSLPEKYAQILNDHSGNYVKLGFYGKPEAFDTIKAPNYYHEQIINNLIYASPLRKTEKGQLEPYLLESYEMSLEGEEVVIQGKWRQNLKWHDGKDFSGEDFLFNIDLMKDLENNSPYADSANAITKLGSNNQNLYIKFNSNSIQHLDLLCAGIMPKHLLSSENLASGTTKETAYNSFMTKPVGLGPYKISQIEEERYFTLEPNKDFFDNKSVKRSKIFVQCSFELMQTISDFREKHFDWIDLPNVVGEQLHNTGIEKTIYMKYPNPALLSWVFNTKNPKLSDVKLRKALSLVINRDQLKNHYSSKVETFTTNLIPNDSDKQNMTTNKAEAMTLFTEAGLVDTNGDGFRELNGNSYSLKILVNDDNYSRRMPINDIIEALASVGIKAEMETTSWADFVSNKLKKGEFETALLSYHISKTSSLYNLFSTKRDESSLNFTGISDESLDNDLRILNSAVTDEDKEKAFINANKRLSELCPCAFLARPHNLALVHGEKVEIIRSNTNIWSDIYNWKLMFGNPDSKL